MITAGPPTLTAECAAVAVAHPGWDVHPSEQGVVWMTRYVGQPATLRAPTPERAGHVIAEYEHAQAFRCAA